MIYFARKKKKETQPANIIEIIPLKRYKDLEIGKNSNSEMANKCANNVELFKFTTIKANKIIVFQYNFLHSIIFKVFLKIVKIIF